MSFDVAAESYQRFMGRYSEPLAELFVGELAPSPGQRALDVGAGPGALTAPLARILGTDAVAALDPSEPFVAALRSRLPGIDARVATAEAIPFPSYSFNFAVAQLVVQFMSDPVAGLREMCRVVFPGGVVAACVWDFAGGRSPLSLFWRAARDIDPAAQDETGVAGGREGHLGELFAAVGLVDVRSGETAVTVPYRDFDDWWEPFTLGVGPAGAYFSRLDSEGRAHLRDRCAALLPPGPGAIVATAWTAFGVVGNPT
ncbi:class I SAM-dependent methyltransferase [Lacisediminihabitans changchengi]|uniref:Methyltransferase domain-containing protein n=1 Tax=Lacisediminihabitans changchengi TaxID=2787634 RepID=A0A934ST88_9MICO|nr:class I SAM-dependent methyltransferase [Lacisediminihabitans changchengi]MBK4347699.1 methyltransferase domain-containing protein [Lacisediminihabitans changchengi]